MADNLEALRHFEAEVTKLLEQRDYLRARGKGRQEPTPNLDRKIRATQAAILALSAPLA